MIIKNKVNGTWQELYPKTLADNVMLNDGRTIEEYKNVLDSRVPSDIPLWDGDRYPDETQTVTPSKGLSDCPNGWLLRWQAYTPGTGTSNSNIQYTQIPRFHASYNNGHAVRFTLGRTGGILVFKYIYVYDDHIVGHESNKDAENARIALTGIFEY